MATVSLIPVSQMTELIQASEAKSIAESASIIHEQQQVAHAINSAVNTGRFECIFNNAIGDTTVQALESAGYTVTSVSDSVHAQTIIRWEDAADSGGGEA